MTTRLSVHPVNKINPRETPATFTRKESETTAKLLEFIGKKLAPMFERHGTTKELNALVKHYKTPPINHRFITRIERDWKPEEVEKAKIQILHLIHTSSVPGKTWSLLAQLIAKHDTVLQKRDFPKSITNRWPRNREQQIEFCLEQSLKNDPKEGAAWYHLGMRCYIGKKVPLRILPMGKRKLFPEAWQDQAKFCFLGAHRTDPKNGQALSRLADLMSIHSVNIQKSDLHPRYREKYPSTWDEQVLFLYTEGLKNAPEDSDAWLGIGELIHNKELDITLPFANWPTKRNDQIAFCFLKAIEFNHKNRRAWSLLGALILKQDLDIPKELLPEIFQSKWPQTKPQRALFCFLRSWTILPDDKIALINIGSLIRASEKAVSRDEVPTSRQKKWPREWLDQAIYCLSEAIDLDSECGRAWSEMATLISLTKKSLSRYQMRLVFKVKKFKSKAEQVKQCLLNAIKFDSKEVLPWINLSALIETDEVEIPPSSFDNEIAQYWPKNHIDQRSFCLVMALSIDPTNEIAWRCLGNLLYDNSTKISYECLPDKMKKYWPKEGNFVDQALHCYLQALRHNPHNKENWTLIEFLLEEEDVDIPAKWMPSPHDEHWPNDFKKQIEYCQSITELTKHGLALTKKIP